MERREFTCDEVKGLFERLLDGEVAGREEQALRDHLASCERCSKSFALDLAIIETMRTSLDEAFESVAGEVVERVGARNRKLVALRLGLAAAALGGVAVLINRVGTGALEYILSMVTSDAARRPEIVAFAKIAGLIRELARSFALLLVEGVAGETPGVYLPYILGVVITGCLFVMFIMYVMGRWLRKPGEVRSWQRNG